MDRQGGNCGGPMCQRLARWDVDGWENSGQLLGVRLSCWEDGSAVNQDKED